MGHEMDMRQKPLQSIALLIIAVLAFSAFFVPPEICKLYQELCRNWRFLIHFDKVFHFAFFASLAFFMPGQKQAIGRVLIPLALVVLGMGIEGIQYYIPDRGASIHDLTANILGLVFGVIFKIHINKQEQKNELSQ